MIFGFKPIESVCFRFDDVTRNEKNNFDKFPTFRHGLFFLLFSRKKLISFGRSYTSPFAFIKLNKERF